ncbi:GatB/YqeY domain-containing protein [uncultured Umboniibacter sp.]|uniref:GatB/YqeY domain-containing protein n=1 Tax=uncultured Umboniibacter sp. TaxID=1798917 RepID=UPI00262DB55C|nr:GatB/YqeY domain-containing protein [uncultured Umboniibacter sp.]
MSSAVQQSISAATKQAMRDRAKARLGVLRMINAEFKRIEVDERIELDDSRCLAVLDKMSKQRRDALDQYKSADRQDLADIEEAELAIIQEFLPKALSDDEIIAIVSAAKAETGAASMQDMGKLMALVKPQVQGRADMGAVSKLVKAALSA